MSELSLNVVSAETLKMREGKKGKKRKVEKIKRQCEIKEGKGKGGGGQFMVMVP